MLLLAIVMTIVVVLIEWWAVATDQTRVEEVAKPLVMVGLIAVALAIESPPPGVRLWIVVALIFGLVGDVFLRPRTPSLGWIALFGKGQITGSRSWCSITSARPV